MRRVRILFLLILVFIVGRRKEKNKLECKKGKVKEKWERQDTYS
jgi:hypothetical protein